MPPVPFEVAPVLDTHPETIEVENMQRQSALAHAVDERADGLLVVSVVNEVVSNRPKDHGGKAALPVSGCRGRERPWASRRR